MEFINDVEWNDQAFEHLVIDTETKELVKAVVTTQLRAEENTDLIRGKGNGLFILLHGCDRPSYLSSYVPSTNSCNKWPRHREDLDS